MAYTLHPVTEMVLQFDRIMDARQSVIWARGENEPSIREALGIMERDARGILKEIEIAVAPLVAARKRLVAASRRKALDKLHKRKT